MTDVEYEALIAHLRQHIEDLTAERDRLKEESANEARSLMASDDRNAVLCTENADMFEALQVLGLAEEVETDDMA